VVVVDRPGRSALRLELGVEAVQVVGARAVEAPVAQWIERRFPKPCVAGSSPAGGAM
jgi:hypothetical protein